MEPATGAEAESAGKEDDHPVSPQVAASSPALADGTGSPGAPTFPLVSVATAAMTVKVAVGEADRSATSSASAMLGASSFLSGGLATVVPQEVTVPLSTTDEALKRLWEALKEVGQAVEPSLKV